MKPRKTLHESLPGLRRILKRFAPYIRKQRLLVAGSLVALIAEVCLRTLEPWPLKFIVDHLLDAKSGHRFHSLAFVDELPPSTLLPLAAVTVVVITGLRCLADYANTIGFALVGNRVLTKVRAELYRHLQGLSLSFHTKARSGDLIIRVMSDVNMLKDVAVTAALPLLASVLIVAGMIVVMFTLHWKLTLVALSMLPLFAFLTSRLTGRIQHAARNQRHRESVMAATASEAIGAMKLVQALGLEGWFTDRFARRNKESQKEDLKGARLSAALARSVGFLLAVSTALVLWYGGWLVIKHELTPGELLVFLAYLRSTFHPVQDFAKYSARLAKATAAGERVVNILEQTPEVHDLPGANPAPPFQGAVRFADVCFAYEPGRLVLDQICFEAAPGQRIAIVGPSGIGKSTITSLMLRLYDPLAGRVMFDGHDIREYTLASLRAQISIVLQDTLLFATSVRENISLGALHAAPDEVEAAARLANAHDFICDLPKGYDTVVGERGVTLSGGQRQRIAIARAAIRKTPILILDEPTTGLDEANERAVLLAFERLARGRTTFLIAHDLKVASSADHILYVEHGRVIESGTQEELMEHNGRYAALFRSQMTEPNRSCQQALHSPETGSLKRGQERSLVSFPD
jgi:ATP-binding cassette subfamily B protein